MSRAIPFVATLVIAGVTLFSPAESNAGDDVCDWQNNPYNRPEGHLITRQSHPEISLTEGCNRRPFTDTTSLLSHNLDGGVRVVSDQEYNQLPSAGQIRAREGTVFRNSSTGWYYIIDRSGTSTFKKRLITSNRWQQWFASCNYPYTSVTWSYLDTYPTGSTISETTPQRPDGQLIATPDGKVYQLEDGKKRWIRSPSAKNSYNFAQPSCNVSYSEANSFSNGPDMWAREGTLFRGSGDPVYIVRRTVTNSYLKRHIAGPNAFSYYGYSWGNVKQWSDSEVNQYASGAHAHPVKGTLVTQWGEWYKSLVTNDLTMHRYHAPGTRSWESQITAARNAWNAAPIAPDFVEMSQNSSNDGHVEVENWGDIGWGGRTVIIETQGGKIRKMGVDLNDWQGYVQSQYLVSHELGHVVLLAHDGIAGGVGDGFCGGTRVPQTVMDYDCTSLTGPANWDSCGVNHIHHAGSYGGC